MSVETEVRGLERFRSTMRRAGDELADMRRAGAAAGAIIAADASAAAPRRSGALASSLSYAAGPDGGERISSSLAYAGVIHYGWPARGIAARRFLTGATARTESAWLGAYEKDAQRILDTVKGA